MPQPSLFVQNVARLTPLVPDLSAYAPLLGARRRTEATGMESARRNGNGPVPEGNRPASRSWDQYQPVAWL